jgi:hypothetical protein
MKKRVSLDYHHTDNVGLIILEEFENEEVFAE